MKNINLSLSSQKNLIQVKSGRENRVELPKQGWDIFSCFYREKMMNEKIFENSLIKI